MVTVCSHQPWPDLARCCCPDSQIIKGISGYLGKNWRKSYMHILSQIDAQVRHHVQDPWFYEDRSEWSDHHAEEQQLGERVKRFNKFNYYGPDADDPKPQLSSIFHVEWDDIVLDDEFKKNYETWLEAEVYSQSP